MSHRFKRPSSSQVTPSSIARETDASKRAKFRPSYTQQAGVQQRQEQAPLLFPPGSDVASQASSGSRFGQLHSAPLGGPTIGRVAAEEAGKERGSRVDMGRMERMMYSASERDEEDGEEPVEGHGEDVARKMTSRLIVLHAPSPGNLAGAWYDPEELKIEVLEDTKDTPSWDLATLVLEQVQPDVILMSTSTQLSLVDQVTKWGENATTRITMLRHNLCTISLAHSHLATIHLPDRSIPVFAPDGDESVSRDSQMGHEVEYREEGAGMGYHRLSLVKLGCWVDVTAPHAIICTGVLVAEVKKELANSLSGEAASVNGLPLTSLDSMNLEQHMQIDKDALTSLAIFDTEAHAFMHSDVQKQALSVYGLLNRTVTPLGRKLMHTWHLRPLLNLSDITARHDAVSLFSSPDVIPITHDLRKELKKIKNLDTIFTKLRDGSGKYSEWAGLRNSLTALETIKDTAASVTHLQKNDVLDKVSLDGEDSRLTLADSTVTKTSNFQVDWNESKSQSRMTIQWGVDEDLDRWRDEYAGDCSAHFTEVARHLSPRVPLGITRDISVLYITQIGFHVVLQIEGEDPPKIENWVKKFRIEDKIYYQCKETKDLDSHFGDIVNLIRGREVDIMQGVAEKVFEQEARVLAATEVVTELDCLLALAVSANQLDLHRPTMTNDRMLRIKNGRHLLYERTTERYIGNNTLLQGGKDGRYHSMMVVTGANGSGKSAYGKQASDVALIVFMAQIGSFVPAAEATIGVCDKIYTRLSTKESASRPGSAFMIDLGQVSQALRGATDRSLIILDEFGKGTISWDGVGLLTGVIEYLLSTCCPRTIVATHFHQLFNKSLLAEDQQVQFAHMKCMTAKDTNELHFLYKLVPQPCPTSYAAECALHHGVPKEIVDRARFVTECMANFQFHKIHDVHLTPQQVKEARRAEQIVKEFFLWEVDEESEDVQQVLIEMLEHIDMDGLDGNSSGEESGNEDRSRRARDTLEGGALAPKGHERKKVDDAMDGESLAPSDVTD
ncbi:hypothetical protein I316_03604 [Kwoniella heveanensis BCC8398]|uniref:DNA mismatch repair proteins mutS family domain-containing protein n=1 Tax=Kwoniella heveanensis BCC8398 TaxID=1296120 RepID=A0A1B9GU52_9TREE|nr:hypothetical protein I316_03604 [Kwoniella heveanensis BCC8398]